MIQIRLSERESQIKSDRGNNPMIQIRLSVFQRLIFQFQTIFQVISYCECAVLSWPKTGVIEHESE